MRKYQKPGLTMTSYLNVSNVQERKMIRSEKVYFPQKKKDDVESYIEYLIQQDCPFQFGLFNYLKE